ncbi:MAG: transcriptional repressor LexA [Clostridia bacterium]|nr:transcriptional repressor LexA [Clostridia bacterium]
MRKMSEELLNNIKDFIEDFVAENGYPPSVRDISSSLNIKSTATVYKYLGKLNDLGIISKENNKTRALKVSSAVNKGDFSSVPLVGKIAAGEPITAIENIEDNFILPNKMFPSDELFMLKVVGDSMIDVGILNGDMVVMQKTETCENGDIVAALIDDSATVKRFYKEKNKIRLHPENKNLDDIIVEDCMILGKLVGLLRKY